jgi:dTDP-4-dehydrorhamnose reductase
MRILILGSSGLLGKALTQEWTGDEVTGLSSKDLDIRDSEAVLTTLDRLRPDWIVLAAAYTDVDGCETNRELAMDVNCRGAVNVARAAKPLGSRLFFLSSDYVFDGTKNTPYEISDQRAPINFYGKTKAEAEVQLLEILPGCCIARTSWLFGAGGKCFPDTILRFAVTRTEIDVVDDQRGCPTYTRDLARTIIQLCRRGGRGMIHVTNSGDCTWFDFAAEIVRAAGLKTIVRPTTSNKMPRPAQRPKYSVLSPHSLMPYAIALPNWKDALRRYLAERSISPVAT